MAKEKKPVYNFPSVFGSHSSMINEVETEKLEDKSLVVLTDEFGNYITERNRIDTRLADPNRYKTSRLEKLFSHKKKDEETEK